MAQSAGLLQDSLTGLTLHQFFSMHCSQALLTAGVDVDQIVQEVEKLGVEKLIGADQRLFTFGEQPDTFYLILRVSARLLELVTDSGMHSGFCTSQQMLGYSAAISYLDSRLFFLSSSCSSLPYWNCLDSLITSSLSPTALVYTSLLVSPPEYQLLTITAP